MPARAVDRVFALPDNTRGGFTREEMFAACRDIKGSVIVPEQWVPVVVRHRAELGAQWQFRVEVEAHNRDGSWAAL